MTQVLQNTAIGSFPGGLEWGREIQVKNTFHGVLTDVLSVVDLLVYLPTVVMFGS